MFRPVIAVLLLSAVQGFTQAAAIPGAVHDFDFLIGSWTMHNRFLKGRLQNSHEWIEFDGTLRVQPILKGLGNIDEYSALREGRAIEGATLRLFNPATGDWSLYWVDNVRAGILQPPMVGKFRGEVGEFFGDEEVSGRKVLCRFRWTRTNPDAPQWEQAFSADGGKTWETNWIVTFTRENNHELVRADPAPPAAKARLARNGSNPSDSGRWFSGPRGLLRRWTALRNPHALRA